MNRSLALLALSVTLACTKTQPGPSDPVPDPNPALTDAQELEAFARLYGYVRFFHPSDAAAAANWDALAIAGAREVIRGHSREELRAALQTFVDPIAPTVEIYAEDQPPPELVLEGEGPEVAWQHAGWGFGAVKSAYESVRIGRTRAQPLAGSPWGSINGNVEAEPLYGKRLRLSARVRVGEGAEGHLVIGVEDEAGEFEILAFTSDDPIPPGDWVERSVEVELPERGAKVGFGGVALGQGPVAFDDFTLTIVGGRADRPVTVQNPGFEAGDEGWTLGADNFSYEIVDDGGTKVARIQQKIEETSAPLFEATPAPGEVVDLELGAGLRVRLPVSLPDSLAASPALEGWAGDPAGDPAAVDPAGDPAVRAAAVIVGWNVLRHFYPYFDTIPEVDWDEVLEQTLADVLDDRGPEDVRATLERMLAKLHDGHAHVQYDAGPPRAIVQVQLARVEGEIVVIASPDGSGLLAGDVLVSVDGVAIEELIAEASTRSSGSPQWIDVKLLRWGRITAGPVDQPAKLELVRGGEAITVEVAREAKFFEAPPAHAAIERFDDGVFYVDLARASWPEIQAKLAEIAAAPGVVFDLRGYPNGTHDILLHLMDAPDSTDWMFVPQYVYPNQDRVAGWEGLNWDMAPAEPRITGRVAFMTDGRAISYAESVMGLVEGLKLGEIVGSPTAGANGNVNPFDVPGGFRLTYTGMKVTRLDGRQHHRIGVQPTIPAEPTIAGVLAERDEVLEAALAVVRGQPADH